MLRMLIEHHNRFVSHQELFTAATGDAQEMKRPYNYTGAFICRIRRKLKLIDAEDVIVRKNGLGYRLTATMIETV